MNTLHTNTYFDKSRILRLTMLLVVTLSTLINFLSITLFYNPSVDEVIYSYAILFKPSGYSIAIWIVHVFFIGYGVLQLVTDRRSQPEFDKLALPLILTTLFELGWQYNFIRGEMTLGMLFMTGMLVSACLLYVRAHSQFNKNGLSAWWKVPFSLYLAWISVIFISATASWLIEMKWNIYFNEVISTVIVIFMLGMLGALMALGRQDTVYPLVMGWCTISIWVEYSQLLPSISIAGLTIGMFLIWCSVVSLVQSIGITQRSLDPVS